MKNNMNNTLPNFKLDTNNISSEVFRSSPSTPVSASIPLKKSNKPSKTSNSASSSSSTSSTTASTPFSQGRQPTVATISLAPTTTTTVVTTTTTTTTSFPPLLLNPPPLPKQLDPKEYPLADTPTPPVLKRFCFDLNGQPAYIREHEDTEEQLLKLQEALYNMRASGPTSSTSKTVKTATYHSFNDNFNGAKPSESGARKRPASPLELTLEPPKQSSNNNSIDSNELSNHLSKTTRAYRSLSPPHKKVCAKSSSSMVTSPSKQENDPISQRQWLEFSNNNDEDENDDDEDGDDDNITGIKINSLINNNNNLQVDSRQSITPSTSSNSRHYNAMSTSNLGMDTPSTARSTQSSALPSPSLSPNNNTNQFETFFANHSSNTNMNDDDNLTTIIDDNWSLQQQQSQQQTRKAITTTTTSSELPSLWDLNTMLATFDALPPSMKSYMLFQLLRRCPTNTLQYVSSIILPALRKDFLGTLPLELSLHIVRYLDASSMCKAAQVNQRWRNVVDGDGFTWKKRLLSDGFNLEESEEARAISENWGFANSIKSSTTTKNNHEDIDSNNKNNYDDDGSSRQVDISSSEERTIVEIDEDDNTEIMRVINNNTRIKIEGSESSRHILNNNENNDNDNDDNNDMVVDSDEVPKQENSHTSIIEDDDIDIDIDNGDGDGDGDDVNLQGSYTLSPSSTEVQPSSSNNTNGNDNDNNDSHSKDDDNNDSSHTKEISSIQNKGKGRADVGWDSTELYQDEPNQDDDKPYDGDDSDVDAMSQENGDHVDTSDDKLPLPPSTNHPYKEIYRRHYLTRKNWSYGRHKHISFQGHGNNVVTCLQFDSEKIISGSDDQCINVYDTATGRMINRLEGHDGGVWALQYVDKTLVSGSTDRTVRIWDLSKGICTHVFPGHTSTVRCLQIITPQNVNPNPNEPPIIEPPIPLIVTGSRDSTLKVWRLPNESDSPYHPTIPSSPSDNAQFSDNPFFIRTLQGHNHSVRALAGVGNTLVSGSYDCTVRVWNIMTGECVWRLQGHSQKVYSVVLDAKRKKCMSGSMDGTVKVWSLEDGTNIWTLEGHSSLVGLLDLSHDYLVSAAADSSLRIWNPDDGTCKHVLTTHSGAITCFQHDEDKVISGSDGTLRMWDVKTGKHIRDLLTGLSGVWQVRFDERRCVAAVQRNSVTWFEVLDFGVFGIEEGKNTHNASCTDENGNWISKRIIIG